MTNRNTQVFVAERLGLEPRQHLRADRLAICSITTLAPLLENYKNSCNNFAVANVTYSYITTQLFLFFF